MKTIVILCDGMADYPVPELDGKTPLEVAKKPYIDKICQMGKIGMVKTVPDGFSPGSDVANLSVMGYDPDKGVPDFESEFSVSTKPTETLFALSNHDNVIYLNTFSKTISPSLRIGYMVLPKHLVETFHKKLGFYSCTVPTFMQYVLTELINNNDFERHINRVRRKKRKEESTI